MSEARTFRERSGISCSRNPLAAEMKSALILAGGESRRFPGAKAFARFRGRPMVAWVAAALAPCADEILFSVGTPAEGRALRTAIPDAFVVTDERRDRGPIEGFHRGFRAARGDIVLVAPCDAPLLRGELYDLLVSSLGDHEAAVPRLEVIDPLRAVYRRDAALRELGSSSADPRSPSALVDWLDAVEVGEQALRRVDPDLSSFIDVNRPEDLPKD